MATTETVTTATTLEIEITLTGSVSAYRPGARQSLSHPGEPDDEETVDDIDIEDIGSVKAAFSGGKHTWATTTLLKGVDRKSEAYQQIVRNLIEALGDEAARLLSAEYHDKAA